MSTFGSQLRVTTFGESHGAAVGCVIDNFPPKFALELDAIQAQLTRRRPGQSVITTQRDEQDKVELLSGMEQGWTLGTPLTLMVRNRDIKPSDYKAMSDIPRPGHADYTYHHKYGVHASSGGGRSSARETIGRVAAGAAVEQWLGKEYGVEIVTCVCQVGCVQVPSEILESWKRGKVDPTEKKKLSRENVDTLGTLQILRSFTRVTKADEVLPQGVPAYVDVIGNVYTHHGEFLQRGDVNAYSSPDGEHCQCKTSNGSFVSFELSGDLIQLRCPHIPTACRMATEIRAAKSRRDSLGGIVFTLATNVPVGIGEPCFDKIEAKLAHGMMSLPATKGFEIGSGFDGVCMRGSQHNDQFVGEKEDTPAGCLSNSDKPIFRCNSNHAGGTLGGITSGTPLYFRVAIKPVSSIGVDQHTCGWNGEESVLEAKGRHDPCVLPRAPPVIEGMTALVIGDGILLQKSRLIKHSGLVDT